MTPHDSAKRKSGLVELILSEKSESKDLFLKKYEFKTMIKKQEKIGIIFALIASIFYGLYPVLVNHGAQDIPPLIFSACITIIAMMGCFFYSLYKGTIKELRNTKAYPDLTMVTLCIVILPMILFFIGASQTSGLNTSFLLLSEMIFMLIFTHFIGEKTTKLKLVGALGVMVGAGLILYNGVLTFNTGDMLIILSTLPLPIGNFYAKKAFNVVSSETVLLFRFILGSLFLVPFAILMTKGPYSIKGIITENWILLTTIGLLIMAGSKIIWYEGFKRLDISKAISIGLTFPFFSLIVLIGFFDEIPSTYQWIGIAIMSIGVYFAAKRKSTPIEKTMYASQKKL